MTTQQFQTLILPLKHKLFRYALSLLSNEADAKDVVQDVMMKAWEQIRDIATVRSTEAWCMTVARNTALDRLKKMGRQYEKIDTQYHLQSPAADPLQQTEARESATAIRHMIDTLAPQQREVITLRDIEGYSYKEIAALMDIELNHVKVLLHRARTSIKQQLTRINDHGISQAG